MTNQRLSKDAADRIGRMLEECESIMSDAIKKYGANRLVMAPTNAGPLVSGTVVAVDLRPDEDVQWVWSHDPQRGSYVSGYTIVPRVDDERVGRYKSQMPEEPVTKGEIASRIAQLEKRSEAHDRVLGILQTVCDLMKTSDESRT